MKTRNVRFLILGMVAALATLAAACAPQPAPTPIDWSFKGTNVTINQSDDALWAPDWLGGGCTSLQGCSDEPYLLQVAFRVRIGAKTNSADAWVVKGATHASMNQGASAPLNGGEQAAVTFNGIQPLDVLDALNANNKMDVVGTYTWAVEADQGGFFSDNAADAVANSFKTALNQTLDQGTLPSSTNGLLSLVFGALFTDAVNPFKLMGSLLCNIDFSMCDDVLGGAVYVGLGATGTLASVIDGTLGAFPVPSFSIPLVSVPPPIQGGGFFTMGSAKDFTQTFTGPDPLIGQQGIHTYTFQSGPAPAAA